MRLCLVLVSVAIAMGLVPSNTSAQVTVYTTTSEAYTGRIIEVVPNTHIKVVDATGRSQTIPWDSIGRITWDAGGGVHGAAQPGVRNPAFSWGLSFFVPGLGQFYNGDLLTGLIMTGTAVGSSAYLLTSDDPKPLGFALYIADWIISFVDAPVRAKAINRSLGYASVTAPRHPSPQRYLASTGVSRPAELRVAVLGFPFP